MSDSADAVAGSVPEDRWRLIYNGLDFEAFGNDTIARGRLRAEWDLRPSTVAIGTASSISTRKRLDHFLRLIAELFRSGLDVHGFIAGQPYFAEDERELVSLQALAAALGIEDRVRFLGYVEPVEPLYHAWDVCVSTSAYETFGMTVLEAMACRCPVVAYPGGSVAEVVGDGGTVVDDNDFAALLRAVGRLVSDPDYRKEGDGRPRSRPRGAVRRPPLGRAPGRRIPRGSGGVTDDSSFDPDTRKRDGERQSSMKVIIVTESTLWGGLESHAVALAEALRDNGHQVSLVCTGAGTVRKWTGTPRRRLCP